jgi:hypothetical protein
MPLVVPKQVGGGGMNSMIFGAPLICKITVHCVHIKKVTIPQIWIYYSWFLKIMTSFNSAKF